MVGGRETSKPSEVSKHMKELLKNFNSKDNIKIEDIIELHAEFEYIHPFQDGNGRVGRLIVLKECLKNNIIPFIIEDSKKGFYYRGLSEWRNEKGWLIDTCIDGQDTFIRILDMLDVPHLTFPDTMMAAVLKPIAPPKVLRNRSSTSKSL